MKYSSGYRTSSNWRYRIIKRYKHRAQKFMLNSKSEEERKAWQEVVKWFDDILSKKRFTNSEALGLPKVALLEIQSGGV